MGKALKNIDIKANIIYFVFTLIYYCMLLKHHECINEFLYSTIFCFSPFDASYIATWVLYSIALLGIGCCFYYTISYRTKISCLHLWSIVIFTIHYGFYRSDYDFHFYHTCNQIAYIDIFPTCFLLLAVVCVINIVISVFTKHGQNETSSYLSDEEIKAVEEDKLFFDLYAQHYADKIKSLPKDKRYSIAVNGVWGSGKTSFINLLLKKLPESKYEIIYFYPRRSSSSNNIQEDFFNKLSSSLQKYDTSLHNRFKDYISLLNLSDTTVFERIKSSLSNIITDNSGTREKINDVISSLNKRVVIFIDDLDRLTDTELKEVFKIIHGNADFDNVIYISAFDKKYVNDLLADTQDNYTDKFFNITFNVPNYSVEQLLILLKDAVIDCFKPRIVSSEEYIKLDDYQKQQYDEEEKYIAHIENNKDLLLKFLRTPRSIKLFTNNLFSQHRKSLNFSDVVLLVLLRMVDETKYLDLLYNRGYYLENKKDAYCYKLKEDSEDATDLDDNVLMIIQRLFPSNMKKIATDKMDRINSIHSIDAYFLRDKDTVDTSFFNSILDSDIEIQSSSVETAIPDDKKSMMLICIMRKDWSELKDERLWENYIKLLVFYIYKTGNDDLCNILIDILTNDNVNNLRALYGQNIKFVDIVKQCLISFEPSYCRIHLLLNEYARYKRRVLVWSIKDIAEINLQCLKNYINSNHQYDNRLFDLHLSCIDGQDPETKLLHFIEGAHELVGKVVKDKPEFYLSNFVGTGGWSSDPNTTILGFKPFWEYIIGNKDEMKAFILDSKHNEIDHIERTRNFWKLFEANEYEAPIIHDYAPEHLLGNDLKPYMFKYDGLQKVQDEFSKLKNDSEKTVDMIIEECNQLISELEKNDSELKMKYKLRHEIETFMKGLNN